MSSDKEIDYLTVDDPIPGQNWACLSFISPESLIHQKDAFKVTKFLQSYCKKLDLKFDDVYEEYKGFCYKYEDKLQQEYDEKNNFQTSLRGLKIRGVYNMKDEAEKRAEMLTQRDSGFSTFVGQVGYWLPWDPNPDRVESEVFQNKELNHMMAEYEKNSVNRDIFYEEQKREKIRAAAEERLNKEKSNENSNSEMIETKDNDVRDDGSEPEIEPELEPELEPEAEPELETEIKAEPELKAEDIPEGSDISDLNNSLQNSDPWLDRKNK